MLTDLDLTELTEFRRELHRHPELSGEELETASKITAALRSMLPTRILTGLGGHGVAAVFDRGKAGPQSFSVLSLMLCQLKNAIILLGRRKPLGKVTFAVMMAI
ncbi:hypothetical protein N9N40_07170 [Planktomarina temperata]|nr:hypothetical protein [Planktomarina temperata]